MRFLTNQCQALIFVFLIIGQHIVDAKFDFYYLSEEPTGYTFDIADAKSSNGDGGDAGETPWHTEVQGKNNNLEIYMNSNTDYSQFQVNKMSRQVQYLLCFTNPSNQNRTFEKVG